jgi:ABC-type antimicrobial peptide transport system permease subunit
MRVRIVLLASGVGAVLGLLFGFLAIKGTFEGWNSLGAPPGKAVGILAGDLRDVYVETENGRLYSCRQFSNECWVETGRPQELPESSYPCEHPSFRIGFPPGQVVDSLEIQYCGVDLFTEANYVLLDDGSVWVWRHGGGSSGSFVLLSGSLILGLLLGLLSGVLASVYSARRVQR